MAGTALDTSVIIAGLLTWHQDHSRARAVLETALSAPEPTILPVHALLEAYSVMTRLPPPHRLTPDKARTALSESLRDSTRLVGIDEEGWAVIEQLADRLIGVGMTYDASIVASARMALSCSMTIDWTSSSICRPQTRAARGRWPPTR